MEPCVLAIRVPLGILHKPDKVHVPIIDGFIEPRET